MWSVVRSTDDEDDAATVAGVLTCTPALNALVSEADSEAPVFGYTVPYAVSNVILTLLGPVIVLAV